MADDEKSAGSRGAHSSGDTRQAGSNAASSSPKGAELRTGADSTKAGYYGSATDPTSRQNYTVDGVTAGKPTPETDEKAARAAREARG
jgi:hypothetical protein